MGRPKRILLTACNEQLAYLLMLPLRSRVNAFGVPARALAWCWAGKFSQRTV
jgi:hypothetical protein